MTLAGRLGGMMKAILVTLATLVLLAGMASPAQSLQATPEPGACAGLDAYGDAIAAAGASLGAFMQEARIAERDLASFSRREWSAFAEEAEALQAALTAIDPPLAVKPWHEAQIEQFGFQATFGRTAATEGLFAAVSLASTDASDDLTERLTTTLEDAIDACPGFTAIFERWDLLDGARSDGTPEASPTA